jgi:hypothetical protein
MGDLKNHQVLLPENQIDFQSNAIFCREHILPNLK